ncbi:glycoside hydrolase family 15 protein [Frigoriglobus tundricola]|uniref:Inverting alpha-glucosidase n=1 Tax=Frigoriglobus tundricola TaxID=2774151 RepID=A0A6M5YGI7_9BACT|nr:glycoside hydrolase family 15 protein [Frigoriglobus tundricola]QJW93159.1 inverting alpha-glucosidase [Frigoriglobus tundricola]
MDTRFRTRATQEANRGEPVKKLSEAPGAPGADPIWNSGAKVGVGTAVTAESPLWFTLGRGVVEEVYFPYADHPCVRDFGLAVADGHDFFSWEKDDTDSIAILPEPGVPAYGLVNECRRGHYQIQKGVFSHPDLPVVLQQTQFNPAEGRDLAVYAILNPHLGPQASAWLGEYKGTPMLFATGERGAVALAASVPWGTRSVGFVGRSDGWQDLARHKRMTWGYDRAEGGNVVLTGQIDHTRGEFLLVLAFGSDPDEAGQRANVALFDGFDAPLTRYTRAWTKWQAALLPLDGRTDRTATVYRASAAVLRTHEAKFPPGAAVASLTVPFGQGRTGTDTGGYHLVWPRDLVEAAGGLLAAGVADHVPATLAFLESTQEPDGHWAQNMWLNGGPYWNGVQLDETALAILLLDLARRAGAVDSGAAARFWPMVRRATGYLVRNGPATPEDRWEHDGGYSPFTLGAEIAALVVAADMATEHGEPALGEYLCETADLWNAAIEEWTYVTGTALAKRVGVEGYYVRLGSTGGRGGPPGTGSDPRDGADGRSVSPDALALVRFGLRAADDPRIVNTIKVIDAVLRVDLGYGPGWHRYPGDRYGEYPDGRPRDHNGGVGRAWPLFAGERGHYELAAGRRDAAERMLRLMEDSATETGLIPEQVWDESDIPEKGLFRGRPTTSACPLAWAHAEYIKLLRSLRDGAVFDRPRQTLQRYVKGEQKPRIGVWRFNKQCKHLPAGDTLRIELNDAALVRWTATGWRETNEVKTRDTGLGMFVADLPTGPISTGAEVVFTFHWTAADRWEGTDFRVAVSPHNG